MSKEREALKLALEHIEGNYTVSDEDAIAAIKEALAQPEQEPVATVTSETGADIKMSWWHEPALPVGTPLYTTPPQRTWVGLTEEDKQKAFDDTQEGGGFWEFADAIEAKLKEKNT